MIWRQDKLNQQDEPYSSLQILYAKFWDKIQDIDSLQKHDFQRKKFKIRA